MTCRIRATRIATAALFALGLTFAGAGIAAPASASTGTHYVMIYDSSYTIPLAVTGWLNGQFVSRCIVYTDAGHWIGTGLTVSDGTAVTIYDMNSLDCDGTYSNRLSAQVPSPDGLTDFWWNIGAWK